MTFADLKKSDTSAEFIRRKFTAEEIQELLQYKRLKGIVFRDCPLGDDDVAQIAKLPQLVNLALDNTAISDVGLAALADAGKLKHLWIDRAKIDGSGLASFVEKGHKLCSLKADHTAFDDQALQLAARLPKLDVLHLTHTRISEAGLMAVADNPRLRIIAKQFSDEIYARFEQQQRERAKKQKTPPEPAALAAAQTALQAFFDAMTECETRYTEFNSDWDKKTIALFRQYGSEKLPERQSGEGRFHRCGQPEGTYGDHVFTDNEKQGRKIWLYTQDRGGFQYRFLMAQGNGEWKLEKAQQKLEGKWARNWV